MFVMPVHGRLRLAAICLKQLRRTCDDLTAEGVQASAIVVTEASELKTLHKLIGGDLGFGHVLRANDYTSERFNDGIELATSPRYNPHPADYVVPIGSDDWVDHRLFRELPGQHTIVGFQRISVVREDGGEIKSVFVNCRGGSGIRIIPRTLLEPFGYRPADTDRKSGCDASILINLSRHWRDKLHVEHWHRHERQIVDWKTVGRQLNTYENVVACFSGGDPVAEDPFTELAAFYPAEALEEMRGHYQMVAA